MSDLGRIGFGYTPLLDSEKINAGVTLHRHLRKEFAIATSSRSGVEAAQSDTWIGRHLVPASSNLSMSRNIKTAIYGNNK